MEETTQKKSGMKWVWLIILAVIVIVGFMWWSGDLQTVIGSTDAYQAVFLTNDQVYFGRLTRADSQFPVLKDVYYLQVTQALQPREQSQASTNINLIKLGGELHGPSDEMVLNRDHILFYENLTEDSQVAKAILQSKAGNN